MSAKYKTFERAYDRCGPDQVILDKRGITYVPLPAEARAIAKKPGDVHWRERPASRFPNKCWSPFRVVTQRLPLWIAVRRIVSGECGIYGVKTTGGNIVEVVHGGEAVIIRGRGKWGKWGFEVELNKKSTILKSIMRVVEESMGVWFQDAS